MASPAHSVPDTQLGLSAAEVQLLRQHQYYALSQAGSSHAASQASSQGRLLLDPVSLNALSQYFSRLLQSIQQRWTDLYAQTHAVTQQQYDNAGNLIVDADAQMARMHMIMRQIDELQIEFQKVQRINEIVKQYRARIEAIDRRV